MPKTIRVVLFLVVVSLLLSAQNRKPKLTLDEFFNAVEFSSIVTSPDGNSAVIGTSRADWDREIFRKDLWLYRVNDGNGVLVPLTASGRDYSPQWSPDGRWIAFLSERAEPRPKGEDSDDEQKDTAHLFIISSSGGEAFAVTSGEEEVHSFAWSADSKTLYFATRQPWTKAQNDEHKNEWKDVKRFREDERGDTVFRIDLADVFKRQETLGSKQASEAEKDSGITPGATAVAQVPLRVGEMTIAHDGSRLAFMSSSISERQENMDDFEIYLVELRRAGLPLTARRLTRNQAMELRLRWAPDNRHLFFRVNLGSMEGKYEDPQPRLYWIDTSSGEVQRWFSQYSGEVVNYAVLDDGSALCMCRIGTETQMSWQKNPAAPIVKREGWAGSYDAPSTSIRGSRVAFEYSAAEKPTEVYLAENSEQLTKAQPITSFNRLFTERDLPKAKPYRWTSKDGTPVEGWLMYPPGKFEEKNLPMFVLIHGGPQEANGNYFEADWYQWDRLAATQGWLVFEPNYRGSTGYGDKFAVDIVRGMLTSPGEDILTGVDALVKDGIADPKRLAVGGYSYGSYMTNWLITQTDRFKAAVTGAGAVENIADWGNDDTTRDDEYFLGGRPWEVPERYHEQASIYQIAKVKTPTHIVGGSEDVRVAVLENYILERALHELGVPCQFLILPGEGHDPDKNPWHAKIKVREELKWLEKYGGVGGAN
jgi:dipeptidyl aminopeptidase/acylaminoacyl peptidase